MPVNPVVAPFLGAPWLVHTAAEPSREATEVALPEMIRRGQEYPLLPGVTLDFIDDSTPDGWVRRDYEAGGQKLFYYADPAADDAGGQIVFYVHGGGYIRGNGPYCRAGAILHARALGRPAIATEYRTAPEHKWPAMLDDTLAAWDFVTGELAYPPGEVIVSGDSAGAALAMALIVRLKKAARPLPRALILVSGALDYTLTLPSHELNRAIDPVFTAGLPPESVGVWCDPALAAFDEVSPYRADVAGFPPTYLVAGEAEILLSDTLETAARLHAAGVPVKAHVFHGLWHDFITDDPDIPEARAAFAEAKAFVDAV
jgi:acetyl esterase/lipase